MEGWTHEQLIELDAYARAYGGRATAKKFGITEARVSQLRKRLKTRPLSTPVNHPMRRAGDRPNLQVVPTAPADDLIAKVLADLAAENVRLRVQLVQAQADLIQYRTAQMKKV